MILVKSGSLFFAMITWLASTCQAAPDWTEAFSSAASQASCSAPSIVREGSATAIIVFITRAPISSCVAAPARAEPQSSGSERPVRRESRAWTVATLPKRKVRQTAEVNSPGFASRIGIHSK